LLHLPFAILLIYLPMLGSSFLRRVIELAARLYVFVFINIYGMGKMLIGQFHPRGHLPEKLGQTPLTDVGGFDLAWAFFGYSRAYVLFIGMSQVIGGFMLLWQRTKLLGVAILIPVLLNIIIVDYCFTIPSGAMWSAVVYLILLLLILYLNREKVEAALEALTSRSALGEVGDWKQRLLLLGVAGILMALLFLLEVFGIRQL